MRLMNGLGLTAVFLVLVSCSTPVESDFEENLDEIANVCGVPRSQIQMIDGFARWNAPINADLSVGGCVFGELEERGIPFNSGVIVSGS